MTTATAQQQLSRTSAAAQQHIRSSDGVGGGGGGEGGDGGDCTASLFLHSCRSSTVMHQKEERPYKKYGRHNITPPGVVHSNICFGVVCCWTRCCCCGGGGCCCYAAAAVATTAAAAAVVPLLAPACFPKNTKKTRNKLVTGFAPRCIAGREAAVA